ncbi:nicotinamide mononucleotide adenylyltransferase [Trypanosoma theileri]|uniref:Nicotinamide mononucleotide adenylyltransferase n=1 Tax=Trypanosoma theileri TaxID=67003 RepID=A0A1X0NSY4_9TRYP|nr:nicotinamide mononucleotide adenylyltransferase [Trypanosoma theileri]ORC87711.1 nicotinamide mononucleotide adenylyltransferase [Trypanosoma theileri]
MKNASSSSYHFCGAKLMPWHKIDVTVVMHLAVVVMCGSFNPMHVAHIAMYEAACDTLLNKKYNDNSEKKEASVSRKNDSKIVVVGGFVSPVNDHYKKEELRPFAQRSAICAASLREHPSLALDEWEGLQPNYVRTFYVLEHLQESVQRWYETDASPNEEQLAWVRQHPVRVVFLCGGDLFSSFLRPGCWPLELLRKLLDSFDVLVVRRAGSAGCAEMMRQQKNGSVLCESVGEADTDNTTINSNNNNNNNNNNKVLSLDLVAYHFLEAEIFANTISSSMIREILMDNPNADLRGLVVEGAETLVRAYYTDGTL